jgi:hypothetical protein
MKKNQIKFSSALILFFAVLLFSGYDADAQRHRYRHNRRHAYVVRPHVRVFAPPLILGLHSPFVYRHRPVVRERYYNYRYRDNYRRDYYRHNRGRHYRKYDDRRHDNRRYNDSDRDYDRDDHRRNY